MQSPGSAPLSGDPALAGAGRGPDTVALRQTGADRCPGALALHPADDGMLARVRVPGGRLSSRQLRAVAAAGRLGNGVVQLTARANLQLRGLPNGAQDALTDMLRAAGLLPSLAHDRVRNILASPIAGRHPASLAATDRLVDCLDRKLCAEPRLGRLSGRFLFCVDDGSALGLDRRADVALCARPAASSKAGDDDGCFELLLGGLSTVAAGGLSAEAAATLAIGAAVAFLAARDAAGVAAWQIAELPGGGARVARSMGLVPSGLMAPVSPPRGSVPCGCATSAPAPSAPLPPSPVSPPPMPPRAPRMVPGALRQRDGRIALTALAPLGELDSATLDSLAALAGEVRIGRAHTITVCDLSDADAQLLAQRLRHLGLVLDADSGWVGLSACVGVGRCARARLDVRRAAAERAARRSAGAPTEHWSACERRCGQPPDVGLAIFPGAPSTAAVAGRQP